MGEGRRGRGRGGKRGGEGGVCEKVGGRACPRWDEEGGPEGATGRGGGRAGGWEQLWRQQRWAGGSSAAGARRGWTVNVDAPRGGDGRRRRWRGRGRRRRGSRSGRPGRGGGGVVAAGGRNGLQPSREPPKAVAPGLKFEKRAASGRGARPVEPPSDHVQGSGLFEATEQISLQILGLSIRIEAGEIQGRGTGSKKQISFWTGGSAPHAAACVGVNR